LHYIHQSCILTSQACKFNLYRIFLLFSTFHLKKHRVSR